jgi:dihydrofolate synthase/folylpolyglutamate synthase
MARAAVAALTGEAVAADTVSRALADVRLPARFEIISRDPFTVVDGSHNPQAAMVLGGAVYESFEGPPTFILGILDDKDADGIIGALTPVASSIVATRSGSDRSMDPAEIAKIVTERTGAMPMTYESVAEALEAVRGRAPNGLVVTGSLTVAAEARAALLGQ